ncbi:MAG: hypothetical protein K5636_01230 [Bacteroidales bacterium]|nr:hypothetical protein [Bacteroidales bacterium]
MNIAKNTCLSLILLSLTYLAFAQTQMANHDFEQWSTTTQDKALPKYWHSYGDGDCKLKGIYSWGCSLTTKDHSNRVAGHRGYGCEIFTKTLSGHTVNGVITTGQMQFASAETKSPDNYTYTDKDNKCGHHAAMAFTGRPDSVYFWCKFSMKAPSNVAKAVFLLHGDVRFKDHSTYTSATAQKGKIGNAFCDFKDRNDGKWHKYKFKFTYYDENNKVVSQSSRKPSYILATFSTNRITGGGHNGDKLAIDDIEMIYNKRLSYIEINGERMEGFYPDIHEYILADEGDALMIVSAAAQSPHATVNIEQPCLMNNHVARIIVTHDDGQSEYVIRFVQEEKICQNN